jgi:hypothetical protein
MTKYYVAALIPGFVAIACVVVAWKLLTQTPSSTPSTPSLSKPKHLNPKPPSHRADPPFLLPTKVHTTTVQQNQILPSDLLKIPRPQTRKVSPSPCSNLLEKGNRVWALNFQSSCRDPVMWPNTSAWRADLSSVMRNVTSVRLQSVALSPAEYTVDIWNNRIDVIIGGTEYAVVVPTGMYATGTSLAAAVTAAFIATDPALAAFTATYTGLTDSITISESSPTAFVLPWRTGNNVNQSMCKTLGYRQEDVDSILDGGSHEAVAPGRVDLNGVLAIDVFADELTNSLEGPIGRVLLNKSFEEAPVFQETIIDDYHTFWPIGRIQFLTFRFMVQYGRINDDGTILCDYRPYEFHGRQNTLRLDFGVSSYMNPMEAEVQLDPGT